jgi:hypothetical protein
MKATRRSPGSLGLHPQPIALCDAELGVEDVAIDGCSGDRRTQPLLDAPEGLQGGSAINPHLRWWGCRQRPGWCQGGGCGYHKVFDRQR